MKKAFVDPAFEYLGDQHATQDYNGVFLMFEKPQRDEEYFIGADVGGGLGLSNSVAHVLKAGNINTPDTQVAEWASNYHSPTEFAFVLNTIGCAYWNY